ncbi:MAG: hydrogenase maturation protease [Chloroflexota bacterium]
MILVIGYGNTLRGDDGVGQHIARCLDVSLYSESVKVEACHQLTPELVEAVSEADLVVFVDAAETGRAGEIHTSTVEPEILSGAFTHTISPGGLLAAAYDLYGVRPRGLLISITGAQFNYSESLSPDVEAAAREVIKRIYRLIGTHTVAHELGDGE